MKSVELWRCHPCNSDVPKGMHKCPVCGFKPQVVIYYEKEFSDEVADEIQADVKTWQDAQAYHDNIHKALGEENS